MWSGCDWQPLLCSSATCPEHRASRTTPDAPNLPIHPPTTPPACRSLLRGRLLQLLRIIPPAQAPAARRHVPLHLVRAWLSCTARLLSQSSCTACAAAGCYQALQRLCLPRDALSHCTASPSSDHVPSCPAAATATGRAPAAAASSPLPSSACAWRWVGRQVLLLACTTAAATYHVTSTAVASPSFTDRAAPPRLNMCPLPLHRPGSRRCRAALRSRWPPPAGPSRTRCTWRTREAGRAVGWQVLAVLWICACRAGAAAWAEAWADELLRCGLSEACPSHDCPCPSCPPAAASATTASSVSEVAKEAAGAA